MSAETYFVERDRLPVCAQCSRLARADHRRPDRTAYPCRRPTADRKAGLTMERPADLPDRRDHARRAEVVRSVIEEIVHNGVPVLTIRDIEDSLQVSSDAAARIVERLVSAGLLVQAREGTWVKVSP